jgi:hypothetical protein
MTEAGRLGEGSMRDGKHCPACGVDIGLWPIFSAGLPGRIRCPRCEARLGYRGIGMVLLVLGLVLVLVTAAVFAFAYLVSLWFAGDLRLLVFLAAWLLLFVAWVPVELVAAKYLRENKVLECRLGGKPPGGEGGAGAGQPRT